MTMRFVLVGVAVLLWASAPASRGDHQAVAPRALATASGTAQLGGVVTSADGTNQPIRRAIVHINAAELRGTRETVTDDRGRFIFGALPAGRYQITVDKPGYLDLTYGQKRWRGSGTPISLVDGQRELGLTLPLSKGAVITGLVTDEFGHPMPDTQVEISEQTTVEGLLTLNRAGGGATDERGVYRIYGLPAGTFYVSVAALDRPPAAVEPTTAADVQWALRQSSSPSNSMGSSPAPIRQSLAFSPVFHPSALEVSAATPIELTAGVERSGVDVSVRFVPVARVTGRMTMADGRTAANPLVVLVADQTTSGPMPRMGNIAPRATVSPDGEFAFDTIKVGQYKLIAQAYSPVGVAGRGRGGGAPDLWAETVVRVEGRDIAGLSLTLQPGVTVSGRIVIATDAAGAPNMPPIQVGIATQRAAMAPGFGSGTQAALAVDGAFTLTGVPPGWYTLWARSPGASSSAAWNAKSVVVRGQETHERSFEIRSGGNVEGVVIAITDKITSLSGKLVDGQGRPAPEYSVLVLPVDRALWVRGTLSSPRPTRPANDGTYRFDSLTPGEYYVAAATDVDLANLYTASYLEQFIPTAIKLTIAEGEKKVQDLKIGGGS